MSQHRREAGAVRLPGGPTIAVTRARRDPESRLRRAWDEGASPALAALLWSLSAGYRGVLSLRDALYASRLVETRRLPCPVVSIGNLTLGGTGKTPMVESAARTLAELGARPAVVSRGYGRESRGVQVVSDGKQVLLGVRAAGDEPSMLAEQLAGIPVVVGESRYEAGRLAVERYGATAIVVDDGFQHRTLAKDLEVVVLNGRAPWGNGRLFPRGTLREPVRALRRAHVVVVTNAEADAEIEAVSAVLKRENPRAGALRAAYEVLGASLAPGGRLVPPHALAGRRLLAFAGLASPASLAKTALGIGVRVTELVEFPDHHWYAESDLALLARRAAATGAEGLLTTEKDWVRLAAGARPGVPLWILGVRLSLGSHSAEWRRILSDVYFARRSSA